jgi:hypothetical protein
VQPPLKQHKIGDCEFEGPQLLFYETGFVKVEVEDECPPPIFNPPMAGPYTPILIQAREIFSEPFSLSSTPPIMIGSSFLV